MPVIKRAYCVTAGNNTLKNYASSINENTFLLPTVVDTVRYKVLKKTVTNALTVGWIGSPSTASYLKGISKPLSILGESQDVRLVVIGGKAPCIKNVDVIELPWNEDDEVNEINNFDIGVMPLPDSPWERGKCGFKLIQYMACGLPVVGTMQDDIHVKGLTICTRDVDVIVEKVKEVLDNYDECSKNAREFAKERDWENIFDELEKYYYEAKELKYTKPFDMKDRLMFAYQSSSFLRDSL